MNRWKRFGSACLILLLLTAGPLWAQAPSEQDRAALESKLDALQCAIDLAKTAARPDRPSARAKIDPRLFADVEVYAKAAEWILRHNEFYRPEYVKMTHQALDTGLQRLKELEAGKPSWVHQPGTTIRGYYSKIDGSLQPYAVTLPEGIDPRSPDRRPLHVTLHGRRATLNEVGFIRQHDGKPLPKGQTWVQLDVFGRTNNGYRWSGETDVFEAIEDLRRAVRIDDRRVTLWGFSMGGAGAWHLGLHHPSKWSSVGPGAGFVDFYEYQNVKERLPEWQHKTLGIYDALDYALNAHNVPICTYGGEKDKQLAASTRMVEAAETLGIDIKLVIGKGAGHEFTPEGFREFMDFHQEHSQKGRPAYPGRRSIRFTTRTLKYNQCEWLTIEEMLEIYEPAVVEGGIDDDGTLRLKTRNVAVLQLARDVADRAEIDGTLLPLNSAADGLLPGVYYEQETDGWRVLDYKASRRFTDNPDLRKRHDLQGPIDDAFMQPFVCVRGTGKPWSEANAAWAGWTLDRFEREFDKWLRGKVRIVDDTAVTEEMIADRNLVLFGDPGSNAVLAKVLDKLPVKWTRESIEVNGAKYDPETHGLSLIYPNPLNPRRYVVVNSGHTFHEKDFRASNAWLFPRLGDIAVQKFEKLEDGYRESVVWAALFNPSWRLVEE